MNPPQTVWRVTYIFRGDPRYSWHSSEDTAMARIKRTEDKHYRLLHELNHRQASYINCPESFVVKNLLQFLNAVATNR